MRVDLGGCGQISLSLSLSLTSPPCSFCRCVRGRGGDATASLCSLHPHPPRPPPPALLLELGSSRGGSRLLAATASAGPPWRRRADEEELPRRSRRRAPGSPHLPPGSRDAALSFSPGHRVAPPSWVAAPPPISPKPCSPPSPGRVGVAQPRRSDALLGAVAGPRRSHI